MAHLRHPILMILSILAIALAAVMVILAPHDRALALPDHQTPASHRLVAATVS